MSLAVRVRPRARKDIEEASRWYESQQSGLGNEFVDEVQSAFSKIGENPSSYPEIHRATRRTLLQRFPFSVFYRASSESVIIVAVIHSSRHPQRWMNRT